MRELEQCFCPNEQCKDYGLHRQGNIAVRGKYGKDKSRDLIYCRTCGKRFASTQASTLFGLHLPAEMIRQIIHHAAEEVGMRATARLLELDKDTVRVILRDSEHCAHVISGLLTSLKLTEVPARRAVGLCKKKESSGSAEDLERQYGRTWIWTGLWDAHLVRKVPTVARQRIHKQSNCILHSLQDANSPFIGQMPEKKKNLKDISPRSSPLKNDKSEKVHFFVTGPVSIA